MNKENLIVIQGEYEVKFNDLKDKLKELNYKIGDELKVIACEGHTYIEKTDIVDEVINLLNNNAREICYNSDNYMLNLTLREKEILNEKLLDTIREFQRGFKCEPNFYKIYDEMTVMELKIIDTDCNYEIIKQFNCNDY